MFETIPVILKIGEIEKRIWGHRLYDEQDGITTLLEFLCVLSDHSFDDQKPSSDTFNEKTYRLCDYQAPKRTLLRSLVFNNPYIDEIYTGVSDPWESWRNQFVTDQSNRDVDGQNLLLKLNDLNALKGMFNEHGDKDDKESFENFASVIRLLRYSGVNVQSGKRWTSRFLFPWGRHCLFLEMDKNGKTSERRFFARNGELLFMMMTFADRRDELADLIRTKLLDARDDLDSIAKALTFGEDCMHQVPGRECVLPVDLFEESRRRINLMCDDLIRIFNLPIPTADIVVHAARCVSLNLFCYFLEQGRFAINKFGNLDHPLLRNVILCEALQKKTSDIRRISKDLYQKDSEQSFNAVSAVYNFYADSSKVARSDDDEDDLDNLDNLDNQQSSGAGDSLGRILQSHKGHWGSSLFRFLGKDCGLVSKSCTNAFRYAPTDELIETLASVLVKDRRMLFSDFLKEAYDRYGFVFGESEFMEAGVQDPSFIPDNSELKANRIRLQNRLLGLGLLKSLSDGCEFVLNPYRA